MSGHEEHDSVYRLIMAGCTRSPRFSGWWPELQPDGRTLMRRDVTAGVSFADALTAVIAQQAIYLVTSPQWDLLRPRVAPGCAYFFMKTHRREWCSAVCSNRARVARHAQRQCTH